MMARVPPADDVITEAELADLLKLPLGTVSDMRRRENWEHMRFGRSVRYSAKQVEAIMRSHTKVDNSWRAEVEAYARRTGQTKRSAARSLSMEKESARRPRWDDRR